MQKLTTQSRVSKAGANIACPDCGAISTVYHLAWSALGCQQCGAMVSKADWYKAEPCAVPTITDVLIQTSTADCRHRWRVQGGSITLTRAELLPALEAAYDPTMPDWPAMVEIDE